MGPFIHGHNMYQGKREGEMYHLGQAEILLETYVQSSVQKKINYQQRREQFPNSRCGNAGRWKAESKRIRKS